MKRVPCRVPAGDAASCVSWLAARMRAPGSSACVCADRVRRSGGGFCRTHTDTGRLDMSIVVMSSPSTQRSSTAHGFRRTTAAHCRCKVVNPNALLRTSYGKSRRSRIDSIHTDSRLTSHTDTPPPQPSSSLTSQPCEFHDHVSHAAERASCHIAHAAQRTRHGNISGARA